MKRFALALAVLFACGFGAHVAALTFPYTVSLSASTWNTSGVIPNDPDHQVIPFGNLPDGSLTFNFPVGPDFATAGSMNYLLQASWSPSLDIRTAVRIVAQGTIVADPSVTFNHDTNPNNTCNPLVQPSTFEVMIWANHQGSGEFDRWWAHAAKLYLANGDWQIYAPLVQDGSWGSVNGKANNYDKASKAGWLKALQHVSQFALTFSGGCFSGHGVYTTGPAQFVLRSYQVQ